MVECDLLNHRSQKKSNLIFEILAKLGIIEISTKKIADHEEHLRVHVEEAV